MGRGVGNLQHEILTTLAEAKETMVFYHGSARWRMPLNQDRPGWVSYCSMDVLLAGGVYDLRASSAFLARRRGLRFVGESFSAAFSRAVRGLIRRGLIKAPQVVSVERVEDKTGRSIDLDFDPHSGDEVDPMSGRFVIPDGPFVRRGRETRFVLLTKAAKGRMVAAHASSGKLPELSRGQSRDRVARYCVGSGPTWKSPTLPE